MSVEDAIDAGLVFAGTPDDVFDQLKAFYDHVGGFGHLLMMGQGGYISHEDTVDNLTPVLEGGAAAAGGIGVSRGSSSRILCKLCNGGIRFRNTLATTEAVSMMRERQLRSESRTWRWIMAEWTREQIARLPNDQIETLCENAARLGRQEIIVLCDEELSRRKPIRAKDMVSVRDDRRDQYVSEFHFVCPSELGITRNQDGTIWTGTWVVAEEHAERAVRYGAFVSLHPSRAEPSYLQGRVKAWRKSPRQRHYSGLQRTQVEEGIDFLFEPSNSPLPWKGDATGEKGYAWASLAK